MASIVDEMHAAAAGPDRPVHDLEFLRDPVAVLAWLREYRPGKNHADAMVEVAAWLEGVGQSQMADAYYRVLIGHRAAILAVVDDGAKARGHS